MRRSHQIERALCGASWRAACPVAASRFAPGWRQLLPADYLASDVSHPPSHQPCKERQTCYKGPIHSTNTLKHAHLQQQGSTALLAERR